MENALKIKKPTKTKKNPKFDQGADARKKFEHTMTALFQVPKATSERTKKGKD